MILDIFSWSAIAILSVSYWFQIWRIHVHREVRDLSLIYHVLLAVGFGILAVTALMEGSLKFLVKQIATTIPVAVIIGQILYHRDDRWHDDVQSNCVRCGEEMEDDWVCCPFCSKSIDASEKNNKNKFENPDQAA
ncbi:hypothetical protein SCG7086_CK_00030 [Chlamydiales bacterium SCGC AG-110-P3]|nr:hypothetical protein SCG7086_CK_00030 [Chlamydiales bacterium SCGC AG-110-P3]